MEVENVVTKMLKYKKVFRWTIENFLEWVPMANDIEYSPIFKVDLGPNKDPYQFLLKLYPKGDPKSDPESVGYLSVFLMNRNKNIVTVDYKFYIERSNGAQREIISRERKCFKEDQGYGVAKAIKLSFLEENQSEFLPNGNLRIGCLVNVTLHETVGPTKNVHSDSILDNNIKSKKTMMIKLSEMFDRSRPENVDNYERLSDFQIVCGEKLDKVYKCHKVILSIGSRVFEAMFKYSTTECSENSVSIPDVSGTTMETLLHFLYTDFIKDEMVNVELLAAADKYEIHRLKAICEKVLHLQLSAQSISNSMKIGIAAHMYGSDVFEEESSKFMALHWTHIKSVKEFSDELKKYPEFLLKIMAHMT